MKKREFLKKIGLAAATSIGKTVKVPMTEPESDPIEHFLSQLDWESELKKGKDREWYLRRLS